MNLQPFKKFPKTFLAGRRALLPVLLLAALLTIPAAMLLVGAAHAAGMGYVDARRLIDEAPQGKDEIEKLEAEFAERNRELKGRLDLFKAREADLEKNRLTMSAEDLETSARELNELERQLRRDQRAYNEDYARRRNQGLSNLEKIITKAVIDIAKKRKLDVVFQQVVYASPKIDLTETVLKELKKRHKKQ